MRQLWEAFGQDSRNLDLSHQDWADVHVVSGCVDHSFTYTHPPTLYISSSHHTTRTFLTLNICVLFFSLYSVLKQYIRDLPVSLAGPLYSSFISAAKQPVATRATAVAAVVQHLPPCNRATLCAIIRHLKRVAEHSGENKVSATFSFGGVFLFHSVLHPVIR